MKLTKTNLVLLAVIISGFNFIYLTYPISSGQQYFERLQSWYYYAQKGDWRSANRLSSHLDPVDTYAFRQQNDPQEIKKTIDQLKRKETKTADDWMEIARLSISTNQIEEASVAASQAKKLDPVRDDISQLYYQLSR